MRKNLFVLTLAVFLLAFGWSVLQKERQLQSGTVMILTLQPVDPRSLMQGDYMVLRFALERDIDNALPAQMRESDSNQEEADDRETGPEQAGEGPFFSQKAVVRLDSSGEAVFVRLDSGRPLAEDEHLLAFKVRSGRQSSIGAGSFFFQEGYGAAFEQAKYAEMRVDSQGKSLITHLLDEDKKRIEPQRTVQIIIPATNDKIEEVGELVDPNIEEK